MSKLLDSYNKNQNKDTKKVSVQRQEITPKNISDIKKASTAQNPQSILQKTTQKYSPEHYSKITRALMRNYGGILAIDERMVTLRKRLERFGISGNEYNIKKWREIMLTVPNLQNYVNGVILNEDTILQKLPNGKTVVNHLKDIGVVPGVKVDTGTTYSKFNKTEKVTTGLKNLNERLAKFKSQGVLFTKWRSEFVIDKNFPSEAIISQNTKDLAEYARLSLKNGMIPIVEPEVLKDGTHTIEKSAKTIATVISKLMNELRKRNVPISKVILKTSMTTSGTNSNHKDTPEDVGIWTINTLCISVPQEIGGVVFLSGGQRAEEATINLDSILDESFQTCTPFKMTFSFGRALQEKAMIEWLGKKEKEKYAKEVFTHTLLLNGFAAEGELENVLKAIS